MRTGAIFGRGSCRALKWMALVSVVLALGAGQAAGQTFTGTYTPGSAVVDIEFVNDDNLGATDTIHAIGSAAQIWTASDSAPTGRTVLSHNLPTTGTTKRKFQLTLSGPLEAAASSDSRIAFTISSGVGFGIIKTSGDSTSYVNVSTAKALTEKDIPAKLPPTTPTTFTFTVGVILDVDPLPEATGNGPMTYAMGTQSNMPGGLTFAPSTRKIEGTPTEDGTFTVYYEATDANSNLTDSEKDASVNTEHIVPITITVRPSDYVPPDDKGTGQYGRVTRTWLGNSSGVDVPQKRIGGIDRNHLSEGDRDVWLHVKVGWTVAELKKIRPVYGAGEYATLTVDIVPGTATPWVSQIDGQQDVHFPNSRVDAEGRIQDLVTVRYPTSRNYWADEPNDSKVYEATGRIRIYMLHDDFEAENEVFWVEVVSSDDVVLDARYGSRPGSYLATDETVIEDDETQSVSIVRVERVGLTRAIEPWIWENMNAARNQGASAIFHVEADPPRYDLDLDVRLDLLNLNEGTVVRGDRYSLNDSSPTLIAPKDGTSGGEAWVTVDFPYPDGDRIDNEYKLRGTVVEYSLSAGVDDDFDENEYSFTLVDTHKLPDLTVDPATATVTEGGDTTLTLTLDRRLDLAYDRIRSETASGEAGTITLTAGAASTAGTADHGLPVTVRYPAFGRTMEQTLTATISAEPDDVIGEEETLVVDAEVDGSENATQGPNDPDKDMYAGVTTVTITEATFKQVEPKSVEAVEAAVQDAMEESGALSDGEGYNVYERFGLNPVDIFTIAPGYTADYDIVSSDRGVVWVGDESEADGRHEFNFYSYGPGTATITITATARSSSATVSQLSANAAEVKFDVTVTQKELVITLAADPMEIDEDGSSTITATASRRIHEADGEVKIDLAPAGGTASADDYSVPTSIIIAERYNMASITLTAVDDNDVEGSETVTLQATMNNMVIGSVMVTIKDNDAPAITAKENAADMIAAAIAKAAGAGDWMVGGMVAEVEMGGLFDVDEGVIATYQGKSSDADVVKAMTTGNTLMLTPMGAGMATITVTGADTAGGSEAAVVTHDATVVLANLTMTVTVEPMTVEEGGMATITAEASRDVVEIDGMVKVNLSVVGDATLSPEMIEIKAGSNMGTATLTPTDDEMHEPDGETVTLIASGAGIDGNLSFEIAVTDNDEPDVDITFTLSGPDDMNLVEGMSAELTVTASAAVEEDTEIMIMRDGASTASADDYTGAESITIKAGETTGTTTVTAVEDNEPDSGTNDNQSEMLTLYGMVGNMQTNSVSFNLWDAAVPALPVIAQLLLAAFLAVGGYRRYRRR